MVIMAKTTAKAATGLRVMADASLRQAKTPVLMASRATDHNRRKRPMVKPLRAERMKRVMSE